MTFSANWMADGEPSLERPPTGSGPFMLSVKWGLYLTHTHIHLHLPYLKLSSRWLDSSLTTANERLCHERLTTVNGPHMLSVKCGLEETHPNMLYKDRAAGGRADGRAANGEAGQQ